MIKRKQKQPKALVEAGERMKKMIEKFIRKYSDHTNGCIYGSVMGQNSCDCGYRVACAEIRAEKVK